MATHSNGSPCRRKVLALCLALLVPTLLAAQADSSRLSRPSRSSRSSRSSPPRAERREPRALFGVSAQAIPLVTRVSPGPDRRDYTEAYLDQPVVMGHAMLGDASGASLRGVLTLNLEGLTLERGELATGAFGEGYVDRRHPHTYLHELLLGGEVGHGAVRASVYGGRGFAPFGSDDPMARPFVKYPGNHHYAQILERIVAIGALRAGPVAAEVGAFNGDEPTGPSSMPRWSRFGDSWSARATLTPWSGVELSASTAAVASPENPRGHGLDQRKRHVGARASGDGARTTWYALGEWARTDDVDRGHVAFSYRSLLGEGAVCRAGLTGALRVERTDRGEEERGADPFRVPRPATDLSILGITRWTSVTGSLGANVGARWLPAWLGAAPFVEVEWLRPVPLVTPTTFEPRAFYGATSLWMLSAGVRLTTGSGHEHMRMGRYGAALPATGTGRAMPGMQMEPDMPDMPDMPATSSGHAPAASTAAPAREGCTH